MKRLLAVVGALVVVVAVAGAVVVLVAGDGGGEPSSSTGGGEEAQAPPTQTQDEPDRVLEAAWYEDPDGDFMPTAIEEERGTDPELNECLKDLDCPGISKKTGLPVEPKPPSTLLLLDASGSMAGSAGGGVSKIEAARESLGSFVAGSPGSSRLGFGVFGHKGSNRPSGKRASCAGPEVLSPVGSVRPRSFPSTLRRFRPTGYTPIAGALRTAPGAFETGGDGGENRIVLVTDGVETCGGDPVAEARKLKRAGIAVTVDVVGFDIGSAADRRRLRSIARASGGTYTDAQTGAELRDYFDTLRERRLRLTDLSICVETTGTDIRVCSDKTVTDASLAINDLASQASQAGDDERAGELQRVRTTMNVAQNDWEEEQRARFTEIDQRLEREKRETDRRLDDQSSVPGALASAAGPPVPLCAVSPFVRTRMLLPHEALALARIERAPAFAG